MFFCDVDLGNRALHVLDLGNRGVLMQAIAAIDNALWDAISKLHNTPVYKLLGGYRDRVPVIAIGGYYYPGDPPIGRSVMRFWPTKRRGCMVSR